MGIKIQSWTTEEASNELRKRLALGKKHRAQYEYEWELNETAMYELEESETYRQLPSELAGFEDDMAPSMSEIKINYAMKYIRFIHAQMSSNPPSGIAKPTSQDIEDIRAANAADSFIQYGIREYDAHEEFDMCSLDALVRGVGWLRVWFNPLLGDMTVVDKQTGEVETEGDIEFRSVSPWNVFWDSSAKRWRDSRFVFIEHQMSVEEAIAQWPQHEGALRASKPQQNKGFFDKDEMTDAEETVSVYEYVEKGLPWNGGVGRYVWMLDNGLLLSDLGPCPFPGHELPIAPFTDVDMPGHIVGKAVMSYLRRSQEMLTALDSTMLDNIQAHGAVRMVLPDGAELQDESITNNGWETIKMSGGAGNAPYFINPPQIMPDMHTMRNNIITGMQEIAGINESMMGQVNREMSGFSLQTAIDAGNQVRRRLFKKYTTLVKWSWTTYLANIKEFFDEARSINIVGDEEGMDVAYYSGADIKGGFDLQVDYGESFSLDPARRREEIMQLTPLLKEAGVTPQEILNKIKLNDIKGLDDLTKLGKRRQEEIFEEMIAKHKEGVSEYIKPEELEDHKSMLAAAYKYVMTRKYQMLDSDVKSLIRQHILAREKMAAKTEVPAAPEMPAPPGGPMGLAPPMM